VDIILPRANCAALWPQIAIPIGAQGPWDVRNGRDEQRLNE
jgi:hypothetical protein